MRATAITVHNDQKLELFVEKLRNGYELWIVGPAKSNRLLYDHHLTHDDLEARLEYAKAGDQVWRNAAHSEIPATKHRLAAEMEETIRQGTFWDFEKLHQSVCGHFSAIAFFPLDRKAFNAAKKAVVGRWTDGVATLELEPNNRLHWSCADPQHSFNIGERVHGHAPDWWNFAKWRLHLMNQQHKCGTHVGVLHVGERELHLESSSYPQRLSHVFHRAR